MCYDDNACVREGLITSYYVEKTFATPVGEGSIDIPEHLWDRHGPIDEIPGPPYGVSWDGYLRVHQKGRHRFKFHFDYSYRFYLNDQLVAGKWIGRRWEETEIMLYPGLYRFRLEYYTEARGMIFCFWESGYFDERKFKKSDFCHFAGDEFGRITEPADMKNVKAR